MAKLILFSFCLPIIIYYANTLPVEINTNSLATINMKMNILKFPKEVGKLRKLLKDCADVLDKPDCEKHQASKNSKKGVSF